MPSQCLKTIEKVSFINSNVYILSGQKFKKKCLTVLPDMLFLLVENAKMEKLKCDLFQWFSNTVQNWDIFCNFKAQWLTDDVHISGFEPKIRILHKIQTFLVAIDDKKKTFCPFSGSWPEEKSGSSSQIHYLHLKIIWHPVI